MLKTILFDLDGTLTDSIPLITRCFHLVFQEMDIPWDEEKIHGWIGVPLKNIGEHFAGPEKEPEFYKRYQKHYYEHHDRMMKLFPEARETLDLLRDKGFRLGVVTSKGRPGTETTLNFCGLNPYMEVVITAHDLEDHKPHPAPVLMAMDILGAKAEETAYVGDSPHDIKSGKGAGVTTLAVTWGVGSTEELAQENPTALISSWSDLRKAIIP